MPTDDEEVERYDEEAWKRRDLPHRPAPTRRNKPGTVEEISYRTFRASQESAVTDPIEMAERLGKLGSGLEHLDSTEETSEDP